MLDILLILFLYFSGENDKIEEDLIFSEQKKLKKSKLRQKRDKSYSCGKCGYVATKSSNLNKHNRSKHEGVIYPCDKCEYAATEPRSLKKHIEN